MDHELAKELLYAGFPQLKKGCQHEPNGEHVEGRIYTADVCFAVPYRPTLEELIAACTQDGDRSICTYGAMAFGKPARAMQ
jgi:hypothetical protein